MDIHRRQLGLRGKYILTISALLIVFSVTTTAINYRIQREGIKQRLLEKATGMASILAATATDPLAVLDVFRLRSFLADTLEQQEVKYAYIFDDLGRVIADGTRQNRFRDLNLPDPVSMKAVAAESRLIQFEGDVLDVTEPIYLGQSKIGGIRLGYSLQRMQREIAAVYYRNLALGTGFVLLGALVAFVLAQSIMRPVARLIEGTRAVAQGQFETRVAVSTRDEIATLADYFNQMTERLRTSQAALVFTKDYADNIIRSMLDMLIVASPDGYIQRVNSAACTLLGYAELELVGQPLQKIMPHGAPAGTTAGDDRFEKALLPHAETTFRTRDGKDLPVSLSGSPMHTPKGTVQAIVYVAQDLTPRKQAEEALAERTRQLEAVRAVTTEITRELDLTALLGLISRHAQDLVQATSVSISLWDEEAQVLVPQTWLGFEGSWRGEVRLRLGEAVAGTVAERREGMIVNDFRTSCYALPVFLERSTYTAVLAEPLLYRSQLVGVIAAAREQDRPPFAEKDSELLRLFATQAAIAIENARLHEATLRRAGELQALLRATRTVMSGLDLKGTLDRIIQEAAQISGIPHVKVVLVDKAAKVLRIGAVAGRPVEIVTGFECPLNSGLSGVVATTGQPLFAPDCQHDPRNFAAAQDRELGIVTYLGLPITSRDEVMGVLTFNTTEPHAYTAEEIAYLASFADQAAIAMENARLYEAAQREVAERAKAEEELARFNAELQAKNADLDSFVYIVSHDLKAPLVTLQGMSSILLEEYGDKLDGEGRHFLERIQENTRQMESLIMDLLALSRIGREARTPEVVSLSEVVNEFLLEIAERIRERGITVVRGDLGTVWAIRVQMEQVIGNLLSNAIKYIGDVPSPMVEIGSLDRGDHLEVHVKDNGIGIDPTYHERIFEIFQRLGEIETEGTGIGLTIVRKIVEGAGGRVWVESAKGKGATFRFTWPKSAQTARPTRPNPTSSQSAQAPVPPLLTERHARSES